MSNLTDRVAYIKGLADGVNLDTEKSEGKIIAKMLELLGEIAEEITQIHEDHDELDEYVESIDNDLSDLEESIFGDDECEGDCDCCHHHDDDEDDDEDDDDDDEDDEDEDEEDDDERVVEYTCPHCGEDMTFEVDHFDFDEDYLCPNCHKPLFPETPEE